MMTETQTKPEIREDEHYIASLARLMDDRILKDDDTFAVFDQHGNINLVFDGEQGIFHADTRHLSRLTVRLHGESPALLGSMVRDDNALLIVNKGNTEFTMQRDSKDEQAKVRFGTLHIKRSIFLANACCYECMEIRNFGQDAVQAELEVEFGADFKDIFEVRGETREKRGDMQEPKVEHGRVTLEYEGLDDVVRRTVLSWSPPPDELNDSCARFKLNIASGQQMSINFTIRMVRDDEHNDVLSYEDARNQTLRRCGDLKSRACRIITSNDAFNGWIDRSLSDVNMMVSNVGDDMKYPYAGVPWYNAIFGRDGIIVALQMLWCDATIARGVLRFLAENQANEVDEQRDAEPGKVVHEMRRCEMAATGEVPFRKYYGTVDATPLFVVLAGRYYQTTGDLDTIREIWPAIERALHWMERCADRNGDGFVDYQRRSEHGLSNQGWKDSFDSIMHADGELATGPIALVEVQGYVYAARKLAAKLADAMGRHEQAEALRKLACALKKRFDEVYWCDQLQQYALALEAGEHRCAVRTSNPGHCLYSGIVPEHRAKAVADSLMADDMFTGWGVRTLSTTAMRYNPTSYHNGSVWPHDNSIIAAGMARYGFTSYALQIMMGQFHVSTWMQRKRIPELFCGFEQQSLSGPVGYPVACSPQAWASAGVFLMIGAALGLFVDAPNRQMKLTRPSLPEAIHQLRIERLRIGDATLHLALTRRDDTVDVAVLEQQGDVQVIVSR